MYLCTHINIHSYSYTYRGASYTVPFSGDPVSSSEVFGDAVIDPALEAVLDLDSTVGGEGRGRKR